MKIGAWYQARGMPPTTPDDDWKIQAHDISYYTDICPAQDFGDLFWASGVERGAEDSAELIIIGDGAQWIWELADLHVQSDLPAKEDVAQQAVTYYTNDQHRMNYEHYRKQGYQIGSGTIESAVKQIASQRLKVSGARWNLDSARYVAKARATYLSDQGREHLKKSACPL